MAVNFAAGRWLNEPGNYRISDDCVEMVTPPHTDFWQRTYYGFRSDNASALLLDSETDFTFTAQVSFHYQQQFDQCGLVIYLDSDHWFKASIEHEDDRISRLGSVVTNGGYSDWATTDIPPVDSMWYRLNRRGPDFLIESATDGKNFRQMRVFHFHCLEETTAAMGRQDSPLPGKQAVPFGLYACSPTNSSFKAEFSSFSMEDCLWAAHRGS